MSLSIIMSGEELPSDDSASVKRLKLDGELRTEHTVASDKETPRIIAGESNTELPSQPNAIL